MEWIWWLSLIYLLVFVCAAPEGKMSENDSMLDKVLKRAPGVAAVLIIIGTLCTAGWWFFQKAVDGATKDRNAEFQDANSLQQKSLGEIISSLKETNARLEDISIRLARFEGRFLSSREVKQAENLITAKLPPNQKTLPVVVDAVDVREGRIHVRDAQGFPREFSFSADAKVHEPGEKTQLMQLLNNPFTGKAGILVYENQVSTGLPAMARSLTIIPTP